MKSGELDTALYDGRRGEGYAYHRVAIIQCFFSWFVVNIGTLIIYNNYNKHELLFTEKKIEIKQK